MPSGSWRQRSSRRFRRRNSYAARTSSRNAATSPLSTEAPCCNWLTQASSSRALVEADRTEWTIAETASSIVELALEASPTLSAMSRVESASPREAARSQAAGPRSTAGPSAPTVSRHEVRTGAPPLRPAQRVPSAPRCRTARVRRQAVAGGGWSASRTRCRRWSGSFPPTVAAMIMVDQRGDVVGHFVDWTRADVLAQVCAEGRVL